MKPSEICDYDLTLWENKKGWIESKSKKLLINYWEKDCVIAYNKAKLGTIFIIKYKNSYAGFYYINNNLSNYENKNIVFRRISLKDCVEILGDSIILNKEEYSKVKKYIILEKL